MSIASRARTVSTAIAGAAAWCVLVSGCAASSSVQLSRAQLQRMPREARLWVYDAENDVVIAKSRRDEANLLVASTDRELDALDARWGHMKERLKKEEHPDRVSPAEKVQKAHRKHIEMQLKIAKLMVRTAEAQLDVAYERLNLTRQRQLARVGTVLVATIEPFEKQVTALEKAAREAQRRELDLRAAAQKDFEGWKVAEDEYAKATGDFDSGIWID